MALKLEDYESPIVPAWCPGCGNFPILESLKKALVELDLAPEKALVCTGIGQAPKLPHYMRVNTFNGLHPESIGKWRLPENKRWVEPLLALDQARRLLTHYGYVD